MAALAARLGTFDWSRSVDEWTKSDRDGDGVEERPGRPWTDNRVQDEDSGWFEREGNRDAAFRYTGFDLAALTATCLVAETWDGTDLWSFDPPTDPYPNSTLRKAFDWFAPYVLAPSEWRWGRSDTDRREIEHAAGLFELAHTRWGDFREVVPIRAWLAGGRTQRAARSTR